MLHPVINPNKEGIPGAADQRAVRTVYQLHSALALDTVSHTGGFLYERALGRAWVDGEYLDTAYYPSTVTGVQPPTHTQAVEFNQEGFENLAISYGSNGTLQSVTDAFGNPVVYCAVGGATTGCDIRDDLLGAVYRSLAGGGFGQLRTSLNRSSDDFYTRIVNQGCEQAGIPPVVEVPFEFQQLKTATVAHEVAHGVAVRHVTTCGDLMYATADGVMSIYIPVPADYSTIDTQQILLH